MAIVLILKHAGGEIVKPIEADEDLELIIAFLRHSLRVSEKEIAQMEMEVYHRETELELARANGL